MEKAVSSATLRFIPVKFVSIPTTNFDNSSDRNLFKSAF